MSFTLFGYGYWGKKIHPLLEKYGGVRIVDPLFIDVALSPQREPTSANDQSFIATPEETHSGLVKQRLNDGQHVYVEKPLSLLTSEASELLSTSQEKKHLIFVDYIFLYDRAVEIIKELLAEGVIGKLQQIESTRFSVGTNKPQIPVTDDLAIHDLYLVRLLTESKVKNVQVLERVLGEGRVVEARYQLEIENGVRYKGHLSWIQPEPVRTMKLTGTNGEIAWLKNSPHDQIVVTTKDKREVIEVINDQSPLEKALTTFIEKSNQPTLDFSAYPSYLEDTKWLETLRALL